MAGVLSDSEEKTNFSKLSRLLIDGGTAALRTTLDSFHPPGTLAAGLNANRSKLHKLYNPPRGGKRVLTQSQWDMLFPPVGSPSPASSSFDITLLFVLLRNICPLLVAPVMGWDKLPAPGDTSPGANLTRIKVYRNTVYGHIGSTAVPKAEFEKYWKEISAALVSFGVDQEAIDELKSAPLGTKDHVKLLEQWWTSDAELAKEVKELQQTIAEQSLELKQTIAEQSSELREIKATIQMQNPTGLPKVEQGSQTLPEKKEEGSSKSHASRLPKVEQGSQTLPGENLDPLIQQLKECLKQHYTLGEEALIEPLPDMEGCSRYTLERLFTQLKITENDSDTAVNMYEFFKTNDKGEKKRNVLLLGNPGTGKTTLCKKLAYDWAKGEIQASYSFPEFDLILVLKCRHMKDGGIWQAIQDQLLPEETSDDERKQIFEYIKSNQEKVLFVLDGYDEISNALEAKCVRESVTKVITKKYMPMSYILVTSRLDKGRAIEKHFQGNINSVLELKGFDSIEEYIKKCFDSEADRLLYLRLIRHNPVLLDLCTNPLNIALICVLVQENQERILSLQDISLAELYNEILFCITKRYCRNENLDVDDDNLMAEFRSQHLALGTFAFNCLKNSQISFTENHLPEKLKRLGFLINEKSPKVTRNVKVYSFAHKSLQDYFAALFLADRLIGGHIDDILLVIDLGIFEDVNRYELTEMIGSESAHNVAKLLAPKVSSTSDATLFYLLCQCLAECKQLCDFNKTLEEVYRQLPAKVSFRPPIFCRSKTLTGLSSLLSCKHAVDISGTNSVEGRSASTQSCKYHSGSDLSNRPAFIELYMYDLLENDLDEEFGDAMANNTDVLTLTVRCIQIGTEDKNQICKILRHNNSLQTINLTFFIVPAHDVVVCDIAKSLLVNSTLSEINIYGFGIGDPGALAFAEVLSANACLARIGLYGEIGDAGVTSIAHALKSNTHLKRLRVDGWYISNSGASAIGDMLTHNKTLKSLWIAVPDKGNSSVVGIAKGLKQNTSLNELGITGWSLHDLEYLFIPLNHRGLVDDEGACAIAEAVAGNTSITRLDFSCNKVNTKGAEAIAKMLKRNKTLKCLRIGNNAIGEHGAIHIADSLSVNKGLERLEVECDSIGDRGMCAIADAVVRNESLKFLNITGNEISDVGAMDIVYACAKSKSIQHLRHEDHPILNRCSVPHSVYVGAGSLMEYFTHGNQEDSYCDYYPGININQIAQQRQCVWELNLLEASWQICREDYIK